MLWQPVTGLAADPDTQTTAQRIEGYVYRDAEGRPLPIQSDADIEAFLAEAEIKTFLRVQPASHSHAS